MDSNFQFRDLSKAFFIPLQSFLFGKRRHVPQASAIRVILRPALIASSRQRCSRASRRSGLGSSFLRG